MAEALVQVPSLIGLALMVEVDTLDTLAAVDKAAVVHMAEHNLNIGRGFVYHNTILRMHYSFLQ